MTNEEAIHKLEYSKKAYQTLIDEKVDSGKLVGDGVRGEWKAETPLDEAYKDMIEALDLAIKALEQTELKPNEDCISRAQALHACCDEWNKDYKAIMKSIRQLPSVTPQQTRWIPVSERLPEEETDVLICNRNGDIALSRGSYSTEVENDFIWYTSGWRFGKVIAWMPLPEPYKAESEDAE